MSSSLRELHDLLDDFLAGAPFWPFWNAFMEHLESFAPERDLSADGQAAYDDLYESVYMAVPDPVAAPDQAVGVIGEGELRRRVRELRGRLRAADAV